MSETRKSLISRRFREPSHLDRQSAIVEVWPRPSKAKNGLVIAQFYFDKRQKKQPFDTSTAFRKKESTNIYRRGELGRRPMPGADTYCVFAGIEDTHQHVVESRVKLEDGLWAEVQVERRRQAELPAHGLTDLSGVELQPWCRRGGRRRDGEKNTDAGKIDRKRVPGLFRPG